MSFFDKGFSASLHLKPLNFKQHFYQYQENEKLEKVAAKFRPGWLDAHSVVALNAANDLFNSSLDGTANTFEINSETLLYNIREELSIPSRKATVNLSTGS